MSAAAMPISWRWLLSLYLAVPVLLAVALLDAWVLGGRLRDALPYNPETIFLYGVFFDLPHIVMSLQTFADPDYPGFYRGEFYSWRAAAFLAVAAACLALGTEAFYVYYCVATMDHVVSQQTGINGMMLGAPSAANTGLRWGMIVLFSWLYLVVGLGEVFDAVDGVRVFPAIFTPAAQRAVAWGLAALVAALAALGWRAAADSRTRRGAQYTWANVAMSAAAAGMFLWGYALLSVILVRFVHDATAIACYLAHDANRNRDRAKNLIARLLGATGPAAAAAMCLAGFAIANFLNIFEDGLAAVATVATLLHYFVERFIWRRGSAHRRYVDFRPC